MFLLLLKFSFQISNEKLKIIFSWMKYVYISLGWMIEMCFDILLLRNAKVLVFVLCVRERERYKEKERKRESEREREIVYEKEREKEWEKERDKEKESRRKREKECVCLRKFRVLVFTVKRFLDWKNTKETERPSVKSCLYMIGQAGSKKRRWGR